LSMEADRDPTAPQSGLLRIPADLPGLGDEVSEPDELPARKERREHLIRALEGAPPSSAMLRQFGRLLSWLTSLLFSHVLFEQRRIDTLRDVAHHGTIVYVMQVKSLLDYLYFNHAFIKHDLPLAHFANGVSTTFVRGPRAWLAALFRRGPDAVTEEQVEALALQGRSVFLFLEQSHLLPEDQLEFSQRYLFRLTRAQRQHPEHPIHIVPLLLLWERRPDPQHISFLDDIFGTVQSPGLFRKALGLFQTLWQSFFNLGQPLVQPSQPLSLRAFIEEYPSTGSADLSELLREHLLEQLTRERQVILGPTVQPRHDVWRAISGRHELQEAVRQVALEEGASEAKIMSRARSFFDEIAANQSLLMLKLFSLVLGLIWYRIYDGFEVDDVGMERVREAGKTHSLILIPSHKSHIDYLIISYLFYHYGLMPPHIAAGANLSFWPMGFFFRKAGAFFLRRSFQGENLYPHVFREYIIQLMAQGFPIEFFIEGTRSRTGKLIKPRTGMLDMIVRANLAGRVENVAIVPISVGYEKIIEEKAHVREMMGAEKEPEGLTGLLRSPRVLRSRYGRLYVQFAEPIPVAEYLKRYDITRPPADSAEQEAKLEATVMRLGHRIIHDINRVTVVTPTALIATVLLNNKERNIDHARLMRECGFVLRFLREPEREARLSNTLQSALEARVLPEGDAASRDEATGQAVAAVVGEALGLFEEKKQISRLVSGDEVFYNLPDDARLEVSLYKNTVVHLFVPEGLLASALLSLLAGGADSVALGALRDETQFLSRLFKYEWIYAERAAFEQVFTRTLQYFVRVGWVEVTGELDDADSVVRATSAQAEELRFLRRVVLAFLESYAITAAAVAELEEAQERDALLKATLKRGKNDVLRGRVQLPESLSKPTLQNALKLCTEWKILEEFSGDKGRSRKSRFYRISEQARADASHAELSAHLARLVYLS
jgi:glycerol-3-phosphate O-acyltransferase